MENKISHLEYIFQTTEEKKVVEKKQIVNYYTTRLVQKCINYSFRRVAIKHIKHDAASYFKID